MLDVDVGCDLLDGFTYVGKYVVYVHRISSTYIANLTRYRSLKSEYFLKITDLVKFWFLINNYL